jgi:hypothetical protein
MDTHSERVINIALPFPMECGVKFARSFRTPDAKTGIQGAGLQIHAGGGKEVIVMILLGLLLILSGENGPS